MQRSSYISYSNNTGADLLRWYIERYSSQVDFRIAFDAG